MNKKQLIVAWVITLTLQFSIPDLAYFENYPPHSTKDGPYRHLEAKPIIGCLVQGEENQFSKGSIFAEIDSSEKGVFFILKDSKLVLTEKKRGWVPFPDYVYWVDLNNDGLKDFIIFYSYRGVGLAASNDRVEIFLKKNNKEYQKISYDVMSVGLEDFVDLNKDGKYEIIITDLYSGSKHNYFTYSIYEIKDYKLFNADSKFKGFPKFIWLTDKPNDKDTSHLTVEERQKHVEEKNKSIGYEIIK